MFTVLTVVLASSQPYQRRNGNLDRGSVVAWWYEACMRITLVRLPQHDMHACIVRIKDASEDCNCQHPAADAAALLPHVRLASRQPASRFYSVGAAVQTTPFPPCSQMSMNSSVCQYTMQRLNPPIGR